MRVKQVRFDIQMLLVEPFVGEVDNSATIQKDETLYVVTALCFQIVYLGSQMWIWKDWSQHKLHFFLFQNCLSKPKQKRMVRLKDFRRQKCLKV